MKKKTYVLNFGQQYNKETDNRCTNSDILTIKLNVGPTFNVEKLRLKKRITSSILK